MQLHFVDTIIIVLSLIIPVVISLKFSSKQNNAQRFFTAGGSIPAWAVGLSILATLISSVTFLAYPGEGFSSNWILLVQGLMVPLTLVFFIGFIVPLYRKVIGISAYEYFEKRFGFLARLYSSLAFFLAHFSKMGTVFFLVALAFSKMVGTETLSMIWILGLIVVVITFLGGIEAVVWMDVVQGIMLIVGGLLALFIIIFSIDGGLSTIWNVGLENKRIGFGPWDFNFARLTFWVMALNGIFYAIQKYGTDQTIVQRYLSAKSDKGAIKASLMGVFMSVPVWALFMFLGTALFVYYQIHAGALPEGIKPDAVFPHFIMTKLPVGVVGIVLAALLAAAISSLDSDLNCLSAIAMEDYYKRIKPRASEKEKMLVSRLVIVLAGLASILIAQYYIRNEGHGVLEIVFTLYSIFSGGIAGMFLLGIFTKRANRKGVTVGIVASILFTAWAILTSEPLIPGKEIVLDLGGFNYTHHKMLVGVYSHLVLFGTGYLASFLFKQDKDLSHLTFNRKVFFQKVKKAV
ncbi:MAG TPA: sodium:solute symporter [Prolixibacteraceae bacterium]|nr:sodium:solute symporter [Prolixibacteraceae bacterium]